MNRFELDRNPPQTPIGWHGVWGKQNVRRLVTHSAQRQRHGVGEDILSDSLGAV